MTTAATATIPTPTGLVAGSWNIDPSHSSASFVVRHLMVSKVRGGFTDLSGTILVAENPLQSSVAATIGTASFNSADEKRDAHVRSADFLDVEQFPTITYRSTNIETDGDDFAVNGELTLHGVTRPVHLKLETNGVTTDPWGGTRAGFSARTEINRRDFGIDITLPMDGGGVVVGDKVKVELEIEAILQTES